MDTYQADLMRPKSLHGAILGPDPLYFCVILKPRYAI